MSTLHDTSSLHAPRWLMTLAAGALLQLGSATAAEFSVLVSNDPSDSARSVIATAAPAASLSKLINAPARMIVSTDLKDGMRATRTAENAIIIGPAHVMASALSHGYVLAAVSGAPTGFALVARHSITQASELRDGRLYLPQQDSLRSYFARGLLEKVDLSLKSFKKVEYRNTSGAGLIAIDLGLSDATVAELQEAQAWIKAHPGKATILQTSQEIPGGLGMAIHKSVPAAERDRLARWASEPGSPMAAIASFRLAGQSNEQAYAYVASLGIVTPDKLAGAQLVNAAQVRELTAKGGVVVVDTRSAREYAAERIPEAVLAPYGEKSLKERDYDVTLDDLSAIAKLDRSKPTVFLCNGPECWKSYKASREALRMGFKVVYWFRGGMPEWRARGLPTVSPENVAANDKR
jgi:rhodanese-related sulfurtransferase